MIERLIWQLKTLPYLCKMRVKFNDTEQVFHVIDNVDLVKQMRLNSLTADKTNKEYMLGYSSRAVLASNQDIRATNEDDFVNDLVKLNHIKIFK